MGTILENLRQILGEPDFYIAEGVYDYGAMIEYFVGAVLLCIVVSSVFRFICKAVS